MKATPRLIKAIDPADLLNQVAQCAKEGEDLHTPLFVSEEGLLCQFVVSSICIYEYKLIHARDLDQYELQARNLSLMGFDFIYNQVMWNGWYLQWMQRLNDAGALVRDAAASLAQKHFEHATREEELALVEDVRAVLRLEPTDRGNMVTIPFPLRLS